MSTNHAEATEPAKEFHENANSGQEVQKNYMAAKAATIVVVGVVAALISTELIPGMVIGVVAAYLPAIGRSMFKSTVRTGDSAVRKTREKMAEAGRQVNDEVAEVRADQGMKADTVGQSSGPAVA